MARYKLEHDREGCIGCEKCSKVCPKFWFMEDDGRSSIIGGEEKEGGWQILEIDETDFDCNYQAALDCPMNVIHLTKLENNEKII